jgi:hypothetical protein
MTGKFMTWLKGQTKTKRYLVITLLLLIAFVAILGLTRIVGLRSPKIAKVETAPAPLKTEKPEPKLPEAKPAPAPTPPPEPPPTPTIAPPETPPHATTTVTTEVVKPPAVATVPALAVKGFEQRLGPGRAQLEDRYQSSKEAGAAVVAALRWLKQNQRPDGSWECNDSDSAGTGLAILAFLGHGETPDSEEFGPTVKNGLAYLVSRIGDDGLVTDKNMYAQGVVTLALSEAYGLTKSPVVRAPLERAIRVIRAAQKVSKTKPKHAGGWRYSPSAKDSDTSVSGWMIMALESAKLAGVALPDDSFEMASQYLWNMRSGEGFSYTGGNATPNMTAVGVLCQQFLGHGADPRLKSALDYLKEQQATWDTPEDRFTLYGWHYITQAMFHAGGDYWDNWNKQIRDTMVKSQAEDGHWDVPPKSNEKAGPVYSTSLGCLILEVYYRYLPVEQEQEKHSAPSAVLNQ